MIKCNFRSFLVNFFYSIKAISTNSYFSFHLFLQIFSPFSFSFSPLLLHFLLRHLLLLLKLLFVFRDFQREILKAEAIRSMKKLEIERKNAKNQENLEKRGLVDFDHPLQAKKSFEEHSSADYSEGAIDNSAEYVGKSNNLNTGDGYISNNNNLIKSNSLLVTDNVTLLTRSMSPLLLSGNRNKLSFS